jgi:uncharacterized membrane protein
MVLSYLLMAFFYIAWPAFIIWGCIRLPLLGKMGAVIPCYLGGMVFGNIGLVPAAAVGLQNTLTEALVALGISMVLFTMDIREWKATAGRAIFSFALATVAVIVVAFLGVRLYGDALPEGWKIGGMAVGLYTGGTPNLAAIKAALHVSNDTFILMHTYDTVVSLIYIIFCASIAQRFFGLYLPRFKVPTDASGEDIKVNPEAITSYVGIIKLKVLGGLGLNLFIALVVTAVGMAVSMVVPKNFTTPAAILTITTLAIAFSFIPKIRKADKGFQGGMYLIYVFCTVVASLVRFADVAAINWAMLGFITLCIFGSMFLHSLLCLIFRIDTDTFIITSVSAICSPPFVPVVAAGIRNHHLLLAGITTGIIGYAIGNYLGISFSFLVH